MKKKLGKLLLVLSVLAAAALVVLGSDWIIGMVKGCSRNNSISNE